MNHKVNPSSHGILKKITREFNQYQEEVGGYYSKELRSKAISAIGMGLSKNSVAKAAGISKSTMNLWVSKACKAKELTVISIPESAPANQTSFGANSLSFCIRLTSGVEIAMPRSELDAELLEILSSIGGRQ